MKWLNKYIAYISFIWWLLEGLLLFFNGIRLYCEFDRMNLKDTDDMLFVSIGLLLIIIAFLLLIKNRKVVLVLSILLLLYSLYAMGLMGLVFLWWGLSNLLFSVIFCLTIPILNLFFSIKLLVNIRKRHINA